MAKRPRGDHHILPRGDGFQHVMAVQCLCRPLVIPNDTDPTGRRLVVHHAVDGREYFEDGDPLPEVAH